MNNAAASPLFALFIDELRRLEPKLHELLGVMADGVIDAKILEQFNRRVGGLLSAARVVPFELGEQIAAAMQATLVAQLQAGAVGPEGVIAALSAGVALFQPLSDAQTTDYKAAVEAIDARAAEVLARLRSLHQSGKTVATADTSQSAHELKMLELFRAEVEDHAAALARGLVELEARPDHYSLVDPLLRAAHSIKGAARAVRLEAAVRLSHALEDALTGVKAGRNRLQQSHTDVFLRTSDQLALLARTASAVGNARIDDASQQLLTALAGLEDSNGESPARSNLSETPPATSAAITADPRAEPMLRVKAQDISRLIALSAENLVENARLRQFSTELHRLRTDMVGLAELIENLNQHLGAPVISDPLGAELAHLRHRTRHVRSRLNGLSDQFNDYSNHADTLVERQFRLSAATRMRPLRDLSYTYSRMMRDLARRLGKRVRLEISGENVLADRDVLARLEAPLTHLLRNAVDHGIELPAERIAQGKPQEGLIRIDAAHRAGMLALEIRDDGAGIDVEMIRAKLLQSRRADPAMLTQLSPSALLDFLFDAGFSTAAAVTEVSGRGVGLDVVRAVINEIGGSVRLTSNVGHGSAFHLTVPISRSVVRAMVVRTNGEIYAFALTRIERIVRLPIDQIQSRANWQYIAIGGRNIGLKSLAALLELGPSKSSNGSVCAVIVEHLGRGYGFVVDEFIGEMDLTVRPLDARLGRVADLSAAAIMTDGEPVIVLDVSDLLHSAQRDDRATRLNVDEQSTKAKRRKRILVVDDSISVRELERQLLLARGFEVDIAVDGIDGWSRVRDAEFDLVITDIDMPRMDGLELTRSIKQDSRLRQIPVVIVSYRDRPEDRARGLDARADCYLTKGDFQDERFVETIIELIGEPEVAA